MPNPDGSPTPEELESQRRIIGLPIGKSNTPAMLPPVSPPTEMPPPMNESLGIPKGMGIPPMITPTPAVKPQLSPLGQQQQTDEQRLQQEQNWKFGSKIGNPWARGILRGLDIVGSAYAPGLTQYIPGSVMHHNVELARDRAAVANDLAEQEKEAQTAEIQQRPQMQQAAMEHQNQLEAQKETARQAQQEAAQREAQDRLDQQTQAAEDRSEQQQQTAEERQKAAEERQGKQFAEQEKLAGIREAGMERRATGKVTPETMHGRARLDKAEDDYRKASGKADALADMVVSAQAGNKVSAAAQPLEGTLAIVTSQGVARINRQELEGIAGAGSLWDRISGKVGKLTAGQPIPPDVQQDFLALAKMLKANAYKSYKVAHDAAVKRYNLEDEEPLPNPEGNAPQGAAGKVQNWKRVNGKLVPE